MRKSLTERARLLLSHISIRFAFFYIYIFEICNIGTRWHCVAHAHTLTPIRIDTTHQKLLLGKMKSFRVFIFFFFYFFCLSVSGMNAKFKYLKWYRLVKAFSASAQCRIQFTQLCEFISKKFLLTKSLICSSCCCCYYVHMQRCANVTTITNTDI